MVPRRSREHHAPPPPRTSLSRDRAYRPAMRPASTPKTDHGDRCVGPSAVKRGMMQHTTSQRYERAAERAARTMVNAHTHAHNLRRHLVVDRNLSLTDAQAHSLPRHALSMAISCLAVPHGPCLVGMTPFRLASGQAPLSHTWTWTSRPPAPLAHTNLSCHSERPNGDQHGLERHHQPVSFVTSPSR